MSETTGGQATAQESFSFEKLIGLLAVFAVGMAIGYAIGGVEGPKPMREPKAKTPATPAPTPTPPTPTPPSA